VAAEKTGLGTGGQSVGRTMLCTLIADVPAGFCQRGSLEKIK
jgi:hypothetical protein